MSEDAFDLETAVVPRNSASVVMRLGRRSALHINQLPLEVLGEIFVQCIPPLIPPGPHGLPQFETHPRQVRAILAQVCRFWCKVLNNEPRAWRTLVLDYGLPNPKNVSLWLMKSKSCLLDVCIDEYTWDYHKEVFDGFQSPAFSAIFTLLYDELTRIRTLFATESFLNYFPTIYGCTILPRMESLNLFRLEPGRECIARFSFPRLRTLVLTDFALFVDGLMPNVHHLDIDEESLHGWSLNISCVEEGCQYMPCWSYHLFKAVPNLISLTWRIGIEATPQQLQPVVFPFLKFISLPNFRSLPGLECFVAPSLENLDLDLGNYSHLETQRPYDRRPPLQQVLKDVLDVICRNRSVRLRHLTLRVRPPKLVDYRAISPHLNHLDTCTVYETD